MWGVERDPRASLGRRGAHGDGLVGVFGACSGAPRGLRGGSAGVLGGARGGDGAAISSAGGDGERKLKCSRHTGDMCECRERIKQSLACCCAEEIAAASKQCRK